MQILSVKTTSVLAVTGLIAGAFTGASPESIEPIMGVLSDAAKSQIAQAGFFFTLAAWIHSSRVKKEIKENFMALTVAIDNVANALREDLKNQGERIDNLDSRVKNIEEARLTIP